MISVILVQHNRPSLTLRAVRTIQQHHASGYEIIVIDNGSTDPEARCLGDRLPGCTFIAASENRGFGAGNNVGARAAHGDVLFFLNNDTYITRDVLGPLAAYLERQRRCAVAGVRLLNIDGSLQYSVGRWPSVLNEWLMKHRWRLYPEGLVGPVDWVTGAAMAVRRRVFESVGGFDENFWMYFEDIDLCRRIANLNLEVHHVPSIEVVHIGGGSRTAELDPRIELEYRKSQILYYERHATQLQQTLLRWFLNSKSRKMRAAQDPAQQKLGAALATLARRKDHADWR